MNYRLLKRILAMTLTVCMVFSLCPISAFADTGAEEGQACSHSYESIITDATCTQDGATVHTCTLCGSSFTTDVVTAPGHSYAVTASQDATCTEAGFKTSVCSVCGGGEYTEELPAPGHSYEAVTVPATCTVDGSVTMTCAVCGDSYSEVLAAPGHSYVSETTATCTLPGVTTYTCAACGDTYTEDVAALGHSYQTEITKAATCTEAGHAVYTCACGDSYEDAVAVLPHSYVSEVTTAATCTESGVTTYTCSACGDSYTEDVATPGHDYVDGVCTACSVKEPLVLSGEQNMLYFYNSYGWNEVYAAWNFEEDDFDDHAVPGTAMTATAMDGVYYVMLPVEADTIVFNDGASNRVEAAISFDENGGDLWDEGWCWSSMWAPPVTLELQEGIEWSTEVNNQIDVPDGVTVRVCDLYELAKAKWENYEYYSYVDPKYNTFTFAEDLTQTNENAADTTKTKILYGDSKVYGYSSATISYKTYYPYPTINVTVDGEEDNSVGIAWPSKAYANTAISLSIPAKEGFDVEVKHNGTKVDVVSNAVSITVGSNSDTISVAYTTRTADPATVKVNDYDTAGGSVVCPAEITAGGSGTITATPATGYYVKSFTVVGGDTNAVGTATGSSRAYAYTINGAESAVEYAVTVDFAPQTVNDGSLQVAWNPMKSASDNIVNGKTLDQRIIEAVIGDGSVPAVGDWSNATVKFHSLEDLSGDKYWVTTDTYYNGTFDGHKFGANFATDKTETVRVAFAGNDTYEAKTVEKQITLYDSRPVAPVAPTGLYSEDEPFGFTDTGEIATVLLAQLTAVDGFTFSVKTAPADSEFPTDSSAEPVQLTYTITASSADGKGTADYRDMSDTEGANVTIYVRKNADPVATITKASAANGSFVVSAEAGGSTDVAVAKAGTTLYVTATPDAGYYVNKVEYLVDGAETGTAVDGSYDKSVFSGSFTVGTVADDNSTVYTIKVTFAPAYTVSANPEALVNSYYTTVTADNNLEAVEEAVYNAVFGDNGVVDASYNNFTYTYLSGTTGGEHYESFDYAPDGGAQAYTRHTFQTAEGKTETVKIYRAATGKSPEVNVTATVTMKDSRKDTPTGFETSTAANDEEGIKSAALAAVVVTPAVTGLDADDFSLANGWSTDLSNTATGDEVSITATGAYAGDVTYKPGNVEVTVKVTKQAEPATITVNESADNGDVVITDASGNTVSGSAYESTLSISVDPHDDGYYVESVTVNNTPLTLSYKNTVASASFSVENGEDYTVVVTYGQRVLNVQNVEFKVNGYSASTRKDSYVDNLSAEIVAAGSTQGGVAVKDFNDFTVQALCNMGYGNEYIGVNYLTNSYTDLTGNRKLKITWAASADGKYPELVSEGVVYAKPQGESRPTTVINAENFTFVKHDEITADDITTAITGRLSITASDGMNIASSNVGAILDGGSYTAPAKGESKGVSAALTLSETEQYQGATKSITVTAVYPKYTIAYDAANAAGVTAQFYTDSSCETEADLSDAGYGMRYFKLDTTGHTVNSVTVNGAACNIVDGVYSFNIAEVKSSDETIVPVNSYTVAVNATVNDYTITFANTGDTDVEDITLAYGTAVTAPAAPSKTGYTWAGWDKEIPATMPAENVTITGSWTANTNTITWNDGVSAAAATTTCATDGTVTLPTAEPTKEGYTFGGWYTAENGNGTKIEDGAALTPAIVGDDEAVTFYAKWSINQYTITFANTGDTTIASITQDYGTDVPAVAEPTRTGYTWDGWDKEIPATMPAENVTITGSWTVNEYTISFDTAGGTAVENITADYGAAITAPTTSKPGFGFAGWLKNGASYSFPATMPAESFTLTADWAANTNTVNWNDGSTTVTNNCVTDGTVTLPAVPSKEGYSFGGWYYGDEQITSETKLTADMLVNGTATFTAKWTVNQYTITFVETGDTTIAPITQDYGTAVTAPAEPSKTGYTWAGWDKEIPATMPAGGMTITGQWTIDQYTITFANTGDTVVAPITQDYGTAVTAPAVPSKTGYTWAGWDTEIPATMPAGGMTITGRWTANTDTKYTVNTYTMDVNGQYGAAAVDDTNTGTTDTTATYTPEVKEGFTVDEAKSKLSGNIAGDGSLVLEVYYSRNQYKLNYVANGASFASFDVAYGADASSKLPSGEPQAPAEMVFDKWQTTPPTSMPASNVTIEAVWADDKNGNGVNDDLETATLVVSVTNAGFGEIAVSGNENVKITDNEDGTYTIIYNSADESRGHIVTVTATPNSSDDSSKAYYVADIDNIASAVNAADESYSVSQQYALENGETTTASVEFAEVSINPNSGFSVPISSYDEQRGDLNFAAIKSEILTKAGLIGGANTHAASDFTVQIVTAGGNYNLDDNLVHWLIYGAIESLPENRSFVITLEADGNIPSVTKTISVKLTESRTAPALTLNTREFTVNTLDELKAEVAKKIAAPSGATLDVVLSNAALTVGGTEYSVSAKVTNDGETWIEHTEYQDLGKVIGKLQTYTIKFVDDDGTTVLQSEAVGFGLTPEAPADPSKEADAEFTYSFAGWEPAVAPVSGNATYKATYSSTVNEYTITFKNWDGEVLQSGEVAYGETPVYNGVTPTKPGDGTTEAYSHDGWEPAIAPVTGAATYTAKFSTDNVYTIVFKDEGEDGTVYYTQYVNATKNETVAEVNAPVKTDYKFVGWTNEGVIGSEPSSNITLIAQWVDDKNNNTVADSEETATLKVTVTGDGEGDFDVAGLASTIVVGEPAADGKVYTYSVVFDSRAEVDNGNKVSVTSTAKATAESNIENYVVDGNYVERSLVKGETATVTVNFGQAKLVINKTGTITISGALGDILAKLNGLKAKVLDAALGAGSYSAGDYTVYMVTGSGNFNVEDTSLSAWGNMTGRLNVGDNQDFIVEKKGTDPVPTVSDTIRITVGDSRPMPEISTNFDSVYTADVVEAVEGVDGLAVLYDLVKADVTASVKLDDNTELDLTDKLTVTLAPVENGAALGENTKYKVNAYVIGNSDYQGAVMDETEITANLKKYTITFVDDNDTTVLQSEPVGYGLTPEAPADPSKAADAEFTYSFAGWDPEVAPVSGEATYKAIYDSTVNEYKISWDTDGDGNVDATTMVPYGATPSYDADPNEDGIQNPAAPNADMYFEKWIKLDAEGNESSDGLTEVTGEASYKAKFSNDVIYTIHFFLDKDNQDSLWATQTINLTDEPNATVSTPAVPDTDNSVKDKIFTAWDDAGLIGSVPTEDKTIYALWEDELNNNNISDKDEKIAIWVEKSNTEKDAVELKNVVRIDDSDMYVYDSSADGAPVEIVAKPYINGDWSETYVAHVSVKESDTDEGVKIDGSYTGYAFSCTIENDELENGNIVLVKFEPAQFSYKDNSVLNYYPGKTIDVNAVYDAFVDDPDSEDANEITVQYKARESFTGYINIDTLPTDNTAIKEVAKLVNGGSNLIPVNLGPKWFDFNTEIPDSVSLDQAVAARLNAASIESIYNAFNDAGGILGGEAAINAAAAKLEEIVGDVKKDIDFYGAHAFGYNDTASETVTEEIRITYKSDAMYIAGEKTVILQDTRTATKISGSNVTLVYNNYSDEELIAAIAPKLTDMSDNEVAGTIKCLEVSDPYTLEGKNASETAYTVTCKFAGNDDYKPSEASFEVTITKASATLDLPNVITTYGQGYSTAPAVTVGNKMGKTSDITESLVTFVVGLDVADLDVNGDGVKGINGHIQLLIPDELLGILGAAIDDDGRDIKLSELEAYIGTLNNESLNSMDKLFAAIREITETGDITVTVGGKMPTDIGAYLYGALSTNTNYETVYDMGYIVIKPDGQRVYLDFNYNDSNGIFTHELMKAVDMGVTAYDDTAFTSENAAATSLINNLFIGVDANGDPVVHYYNVEMTAEELKAELGYGAYTQLAFIGDFGNEMYYAVPVIRAFAIVPNTAEVQFVDKNGNVNDDQLRTFNNEPQVLDVIVDGESVDSGLTVRYIGVQTNGQLYNSTTAPVHAGVYSAIAVYIGRDDSGAVVKMGADTAVMAIEPTTSSVAVNNKAVQYTGNGVTTSDMIAASSAVAGLVPDTTVITAGITTDGKFSENGLGAVVGTVNVDLPNWMDELFAEHGILEKGYTEEGITRETLLNYMDKLEELLSSVDVDPQTLDGVKNIVDQLPANTYLTFKNQSEVAPANVGAYLVIGVVTDSDHYPSIGAGILVIYPELVEAEMKFNETWDGDNIFTWNYLQSYDLDASAYVDGVYNAEATEISTNLYLGITDDGVINLTTDKAQLDVGVYTQFAFLVDDPGAVMYYAKPISRVFVIVPNVANVEFIDENGDVNDERFFTFNNQPQGMDVRVTVDGKVVAEPGDKLSVRYVGMQTNLLPYNSTEPPVHAGTYAVTATYTQKDEQGRLEHFGMAAGVMVIQPAQSSTDVSNKLHQYDGNAVSVKDMINVTSAVQGINPDVTIISAAINTDGTFSENYADAITGSINIDLPAWLDEYIAKDTRLSDGVSVAGLTAAVEKVTAELKELDAEFENVDLSSRLAVLEGLTATLKQLPAEAKLSFNNDASYSAVGAYLVIAVVTDSDHYPSMGAGVLVIHPTVEIGELAWKNVDSNNIFYLDTLTAGYLDAEYVNNTELDPVELYIGIDEDNWIVHLSKTQPDSVGIYTEIAYLTDINSNIHLAMPILRPVIVVDNIYDVLFYDENGEVNHDRLFTYNGEAQPIGDVFIYGKGFDENNIPAEDEFKMLYIGADTMGNIWKSEIAPTNAGAYTVVATYADLDENGELLGGGAGIGSMIIRKADLALDMVDTTVSYDGEEHFIDVTSNDETADYLSVIVDKEKNTINFILEDDLTVAGGVVKTLLEKALGRTLDGEFTVTEVQEAIHEVIDSIQAFQLPDELSAAFSKLPVDMQDALRELKSSTYDVIKDDLNAALESLQSEIPLSGKVIFNGELPVDAGTYQFYGFALSANYEPEATRGVLTIKPAEVTVTMDSHEIKVNEAVPELTYTVEGLVDGETITVTPTSDVDNTVVGEYKVTAEVSEDPNYVITVVDGTITVVNGGYPIRFMDADNPAMIAAGATVRIGSLAEVASNCGLECVLDENVMALVEERWSEEEEDELFILAYGYEKDGVVTSTPTFEYDQTSNGIYLWKLTWNDAEGEYQANRITELDNNMKFRGGSIWAGQSGINGIRYYYEFNESVVKDAWAKLGYTVAEHGTVVNWADSLAEGEAPALREDRTNSHFGRPDSGMFQNSVFPVRDQYIPKDLRVSFYTILNDAEGNEIVLYGGSVNRSIGYIAWQNDNIDYGPFYNACVDELIAKAGSAVNDYEATKNA